MTRSMKYRVGKKKIKIKRRKRKNKNNKNSDKSLKNRNNIPDTNKDNNPNKII